MYNPEVRKSLLLILYMCKVTILGNQSGTRGPKIKTRMCDLVLLEMLSMNPRLHKNYKDKISPPMTLQI